MNDHATTSPMHLGREMALTHALACAFEALADPTLRAPPPMDPVRAVVLGDPQAPICTLLEVFDHQGLLTKNGWLHPQVQIICVGDYCDFPTDHSFEAGRQGAAFLAWMAAHDPKQVVLLLGNHDVERVASLGACTLVAFDEARTAAAHLLTLVTRDERKEFLTTWSERHPDHPPMVAAMDYHCFHPAQAPLLRRLLMSGRIGLAAVVTDLITQSPALVTHAGVTRAIADGLSCDKTPQALAVALNGLLHDAVNRVRPAWIRNDPVPLDLRPLYQTWEPLRPNGGLLIHRPCRDPSRDRHHHDLGLGESVLPRSVPPEEFLLPGLIQIVGHTRTARCPRLMGGWQGATPLAETPGRPLVLERDDAEAYRLVTISERSPGKFRSSVIFTDVAMATVPADVVELLSVGVMS